MSNYFTRELLPKSTPYLNYCQGWSEGTGLKLPEFAILSWLEIHRIKYPTGEIAKSLTELECLVKWAIQWR